ncbi:hypothetical protein C8J56DRAFT_933671 [Mycena floridula]|nr:hypothetical protein C8J56DRAFT_933671 [Mycena floridula]
MLLHLSILLIVALFGVNAESVQTFTWAFTDATITNALHTCASVAISVTNTATVQGVAPYYMMAFEVGGQSRTTLLGQNISNLNWVVDHPVGSTLMLSVVDSKGDSGGIPAQVFSILAGESVSCIPTVVNTAFTLSANVTDTLSTCQPWGLRISGGKPPFSLVIISEDAPVVTNVTLGPADDVYTYINRASPNYQLLAAVSDVTGQWADATQGIMTTGSADTTCPGLSSSPGQSSQVQQAFPSSASVASTTSTSTSTSTTTVAAGATSSKTGLIVGASLGSAIGLLLVAGAVFCLYRRNNVRASRAFEEKEPKASSTSIQPFMLEDTRPAYPPSLSIGSWVGGAASSIAETPSSQYTHRFPPSETYTNMRRQASMEKRPLPSGTTFSDQSHQYETSPSTESYIPPSPSTRHGGILGPSLTRVGEEHYDGIDVSEPIVIQHRDNGRPVVHLPPPYADPSSGAR